MAQRPPSTEAPAAPPPTPAQEPAGDQPVAFPDNPTPAEAVQGIIQCIETFDPATQVRVFRAVCALLDIDADFHEESGGEPE